MAQFSVYIIESPSATDIYEGKSEGKILAESLALAGIACTCRTVVNRESFVLSLIEGLIKHLTFTNTVIPIIHISAHGNNAGIGLTDNDKITWREIAKPIARLNKTFDNKLILCMSSCQGFNAHQIDLYCPANQTSFSELISHEGKPKWSDTVIAYATFYHLLSKGKTIGECVNAMQIASGDNGFKEISGNLTRQIYSNLIATIAKDYILQKLKEIQASENKQ